MNYKKPNYETPDMKVFEMHTEGVMCLMSYGEDGKAGPDGDVIIIGEPY